MAETSATLGFEDQAANHTFLEDFHADNSNAQVEQADAEVLEIALSIPNNTDGQSVDDYYKQSVVNLKKKYEKLNKLRLRGGYVFKPKDGENSTDALKTEVEYLLQSLKSVDKAVNEQGVRLRRLVLTAVLVFDKAEGLNISELIKNSLEVDGEVHEYDNSWNVPFKIQHGRGVLKLSLSSEEHFKEKTNGRNRYYPVNTFASMGIRGPGPMIGSASYDPTTNKTNIWSPKHGQVQLEGNHMDSEELEEYFPRNFDNE